MLRTITTDRAAPNPIKNAQDRTAAKIRYAHLHLSEMLVHPRKGAGDDFERSHIESFLLHLFGARDAFLQELNLYYGCNLEPHKVSVKELKYIQATKGVTIRALEQLSELASTPNSWFYHATEMRHHCTHRSSVPSDFYAGGEEDGQVHLKNPKTRRSLEQDYAESFQEWCSKMETLLSTLRKDGYEFH